MASLVGRICGRELAYAFVLMFGSLHFGYTLCFASPALPKIRAEFGPGISDAQYTLFNSITALAAIFGPYATGALLRVLSRRWLTFAYAVAGAAAWLLLLLMTAHAFWVGIAVRALLGLSIGAFSALSPVYIVELAPQEATGFFGSLHQLAVAAGFVVCPLAAVGLGWRQLAGIGAAIVAALVPLVWLIPDSRPPPREGPREPLLRRQWAAPLLICCALMVFQQMSGINAILTNLIDLFNSAGVALDSQVASAISGVAQVAACLCGGFLIEKLGRKAVWVASLAGMALGNVVYGVSRFQSVLDRQAFPSWAPILIIFVFLLAFGLGAGPIPWFIIPEMFPVSVRGAASSIATSVNWIFAFLVMQFWPALRDGMGEAGAFLLFAAFCGVGAVFGVFFVQSGAKAKDYSQVE
jgi:MFS family permease